MNITAVPFYQLDEDALRLVLRWRNDERVRLWMDNQDTVSFEEHIFFVRNLSEANDRAYYLVSIDEHPIGVVNLTSINYDEGEAELGIYRRPDEKGRGHGALLLSCVERKALQFGLTSLRLKVRCKNISAIRLYEKNGYTVTDTDKQYTYMKKSI